MNGSLESIKSIVEGLNSASLADNVGMFVLIPCEMVIY